MRKKAMAIKVQMWMTVYLYTVSEECHIQAGLILHRSYIPKKYRTQRTQNSHLKQSISWGLGD